MRPPEVLPPPGGNATAHRAHIVVELAVVDNIAPEATNAKRPGGGGGGKGQLKASQGLNQNESRCRS